MSSEHSDISRRAVLQSGLLAGLGAALPRVLLAADGGLPLITKVIPATGEKIPVMGVGTNQFGRVEYTARPRRYQAHVRFGWHGDRHGRRGTARARCRSARRLRSWA